MLEKVLILGGTGAMGTYLTKILSRQYSLVVTSRGRYVNSNNIEYVIGNAHSKEFILTLLNGNHFKAIIDFMNYSTEEFRDRYKLLLSATDQLFYISSARVYADSKQRITEASPRLLDIIEDDVYLSTDDYALAKARQEDILKHSQFNNWTIIRPYMTYSPDRLDVGYFPKELWLYRAINGKSVIFPTSVAQSITTLTYGKDVAEGIAALVGCKNALGETFHITTQECIKWKDIISIYQKVLSDNGIDMTIIYSNHEYHKNEYIHKYDRVYDRRFNNDKISNYVDVSKFTKVADGIKECVKQFLDSPRFKSIDWRKMALYDRMLHDKTPLSEISGIKSKISYYIIRYIIPYDIAQRMYLIIKRK